MNYEKMWEELKETVELIKTSKMNGLITGAMQYIEKKMQDLEKKYDKGASND